MRTLAILIGILVALVAIIWTQQRRMMYFPFGHLPDPLAVDLTRAATVTFATPDGLTLNAWYIAPPLTPRFTVMIFNGNAGNRSHRALLARALAAEGLAVLMVDYRGYGGNPGSPTEGGLRADARGARDYLLQRRDVDPTRLVYLGESLGSAVAVELAAEHPPAAVVLRSPFPSVVDVAQIHYRLLPVRWLLRDRFSTLDRITRVRAPVLVIAGDRDSLIPIDLSRRVFEAATSPKSFVVISGADHNDRALQGDREMIHAILQFLTTNVN